MTTTTTTDRAAWLAERRNGIGASDVAAILGLSPWSSPFAVWADKVGLLPLDDDSNEAQEFGLRAEDMLTQWFADRTGLPVTGVQQMVHHPVETWAFATLDGITPDGTLELKTTSEAESEWTPEPPAHYACQATWQLFVTGEQVVHFGVLHTAYGRPRFRVYRFERDPDDIQYVVDRVHRFWHEHVLSGIPPDIDGSDATTSALVQCFPEQVPGALLRAEPSHRLILERIRNADEVAKRYAAEADTARNELRLILADAEALVDPEAVDSKGQPKRLATFKAQSATRIDSTALRARLPRTAARFSNTTTTRVLRVNA